MNEERCIQLVNSMIDLSRRGEYSQASKIIHSYLREGKLTPRQERGLLAILVVVAPKKRTKYRVLRKQLAHDPNDPDKLLFAANLASRLGYCRKARQYAKEAVLASKDKGDVRVTELAQKLLEDL